MYAVIESSLYDLAEMIKLDGPRGESERSTSASYRREPVKYDCQLI